MKTLNTNINQEVNYRIGFGKRLFDILFSIFAMIIFSPLMLLIALAIKLESKGPVIYKALRVGTGFDTFTFYKFRTMYKDADKKLGQLSVMNEYMKAFKKGDFFVSKLKECPDCKRLGRPCSPVLYLDGVEICENYYLRLKKDFLLQNVFFKIKADPRITRVGKFLRFFHLDELPQFYNVLKGDMSVVGNRPLPVYEAVKLTTDEWAYRFMAPAGITGLWQIHSGEIHNAEERIRLDNQYAMIKSWYIDLKIIFLTIIDFFRFGKDYY